MSPVLQGLSGTAGGFLTIVPLIIYYVELTLLGSTPRSVYNIRYTLRREEWGTLWPGVTLLVVISEYEVFYGCSMLMFFLRYFFSFPFSAFFVNALFFVCSRDCPHRLLTWTALGYSIISPIINGLAMMTFFLFYMLYKYLFTYQVRCLPT